MDKKSITAGLNTLKTSSDKRTKTARLAEVLDDVEAALKAGATKSQVIEELKNHQLEFTYLTFETTLRRLRLRNPKSTTPVSDKSILNTKSTKDKPIEAINRSKPETDNSEQNSHDPAELNKIMSSQPDLEALAKFAPRKIK